MSLPKADKFDARSIGEFSNGNGPFVYLISGSDDDDEPIAMRVALSAETWDFQNCNSNWISRLLAKLELLNRVVELRTIAVISAVKNVNWDVDVTMKLANADGVSISSLLMTVIHRLEIIGGPIGLKSSLHDIIKLGSDASYFDELKKLCDFSKFIECSTNDGISDIIIDMARHLTEVSMESKKARKFFNGSMDRKISTIPAMLRSIIYDSLCSRLDNKLELWTNAILVFTAHVESSLAQINDLALRRLKLDIPPCVQDQSIRANNAVLLGSQSMTALAKLESGKASLRARIYAESGVLDLIRIKSLFCDRNHKPEPSVVVAGLMGRPEKIARCKETIIKGDTGEGFTNPILSD